MKAVRNKIRDKVKQLIEKIEDTIVNKKYVTAAAKSKTKKSFIQSK